MCKITIIWNALKLISNSHIQKTQSLKSHYEWNLLLFPYKYTNNLFNSTFIAALLNHLWWQQLNSSKMGRSLQWIEICTRHYDNKWWYTNPPIHLSPSNKETYKSLINRQGLNVYSRICNFAYSPIQAQVKQNSNLY